MPKLPGYTQQKVSEKGSDWPNLGQVASSKPFSSGQGQGGSPGSHTAVLWEQSSSPKKRNVRTKQIFKYLSCRYIMSYEIKSEIYSVPTCTNKENISQVLHKANDI